MDLHKLNTLCNEHQRNSWLGFLKPFGDGDVVPALYVPHLITGLAPKWRNQNLNSGLLATTMILSVICLFCGTVIPCQPLSKPPGVSKTGPCCHGAYPLMEKTEPNPVHTAVIHTTGNTTELYKQTRMWGWGLGWQGRLFWAGRFKSGSWRLKDSDRMPRTGRPRGWLVNTGWTAHRNCEEHLCGWNHSGLGRQGGSQLGILLW